MHLSQNAFKFADLVSGLTAGEKKNYLAQVGFHRGHFCFEAKRMWNKVPLTDEKSEKYDHKTDI
jgi:hypothetical protein